MRLPPRRVGLVLLALPFALLVGGCDAVEFLDSVDADGDGVTAEYEDGSAAVGEHAELPEAIADVVTLPDGFEPATVFHTDDEDGRTVTVGGTLTGEGDLRAALEEAVVEGGWDDVEATEMTMDALDQVTWSAREEDGVVLRVVFAQDEGSSEAHLNLTLTRP